MRAAASVRLAASLLCATVLHGVAFGVAAVVLSGERAAEPPAPVPLDVDVVEVTPPRPDPIEGAAPPSALVPARLATPAVRRRPREVAPSRAVRASSPAPVDPSALAEAPGPAVPTPPVPAPSRGPSAAAPSVGGAVSAQPRYRSNPRPDYPLPSLRRREEGVVLLNVVVQPDGLPGAISLNRSSGHPLLDRAALDVVRRWTFEPARAAGAAVSSLVVVPVRFTLADRP